MKKSSVSLQVRALAEIERRRRHREKASKPVWEPQPGPQTMALLSTADQIGYGGQAGGGKTDLAVGMAVTQHYRAIIFRRFYTDLSDIVQRAKEITEGWRTGFNGSAPPTMSLPGGAILYFGAMQHPDSWTHFKGRARDAFIFDEATEFLEIQVRSVIAWLRSTKEGQRRRVVLTFNPPTDEEGEWVTRFFAPWLDPHHPNPALPGEVRWFAMLDGVETEVPSGDVIYHTLRDGREETIYPVSRTFIPAKLSDNRFLDADGEYRRQLQNTPEPLRSQLLYGDFNVAKVVDKWQVLPTAWVQAAMRRWKERKDSAMPGDAPGRLTTIGVDIAHGGKDRTVIAPLRTDWFDELLKYEGADTPDGKSAAALVVAVWEPGATINTDAIGYGASAAEKLSDSKDDGGYGISGANAVNVGSKSTFTDKSGKYKMRNKRAEMYWRLREAIDPDSDPTLCLPDDRELLADLCAAKFKPKPSGIQVESKEEIKARIKRSPDCGEAVLLAMLEPEGNWGDWDGDDDLDMPEDTDVGYVSDAADVSW